VRVRNPLLNYCFFYTHQKPIPSASGAAGMTVVALWDVGVDFLFKEPIYRKTLKVK
jgi:hypothetical protein